MKQVFAKGNETEQEGLGLVPFVRKASLRCRRLWRKHSRQPRSQWPLGCFDSAKEIRLDSFDMGLQKRWQIWRHEHEKHSAWILVFEGKRDLRGCSVD